MAKSDSVVSKENRYFFEKEGRLFCKTPANNALLLEGATPSNFSDLGYGVARVGSEIWALSMHGSSFQKVTVQFVDSVDAASFRVHEGGLGIFFSDKNCVYRSYVLWGNQRFAGVKQGAHNWATSELYKIPEISPDDFQILDGMYVRTKDRIGAFDLNRMEKINWLQGVDVSSFSYIHNYLNLSNDKKNAFMYSPNSSDFETFTFKSEHPELVFLNALYAKDRNGVYLFDAEKKDLTLIPDANTKTFKVSEIDYSVGVDNAAVYLASTLGLKRDLTVDPSTFDAIAPGYSWQGIYKDKAGVYNLTSGEDNRIELVKLGDLKCLNCWYFIEQNEVLYFCPNERSFSVVVDADSETFQVDPVKPWLAWDAKACFIYHEPNEVAIRTEEIDAKTAGCRETREDILYFDKSGDFEVVAKPNSSIESMDDGTTHTFTLKRILVN